MLGLRPRTRLCAVSQGGQASNEVSLAELSAIERGRLKEALRAIRTWQDRAAVHYRTDF